MTAIVTVFAAFSLNAEPGKHRADANCTRCENRTPHWSPEAELRSIYHQQQVALMVGEDFRPRHRASTEAEASFDKHAASALDVANGGELA